MPDDETTEEGQKEGTEGQTAPEGTEGQKTPEGTEKGTEEEPETFPRKVVEDLRKENAKYRDRAKDRDTLAQRLHTALVAATGRLADPTDLAYDDEHLAEEDALTAALDALLTRKPHLASRTPRGDVGQGAAGGAGDTVDLAGLLRARA